MRRWLRLAARLYPRWWRARYGAEFEAFVDDLQVHWTDVLDVLRGAAMMRFRMLSGYLKLTGALGLAGVVVAAGLTLLMPREYESASRVRMPAGHDDADRINAIWQDTVSRKNLSRVIQEPRLNLYGPERMREPLEDVIKDMKKDLRIDEEKRGSERVYQVRFRYPDPLKAQLTVEAVISKMLEGNGLRVLTPPTLPEAPVKPDRMTYVVWGLGAGLLTGTLVSLMRWRTKWTINVMLCGVLGAVAIGVLSFFIPNRYTSSAVLRIRMNDAERKVFSDESLAEIIQRPALDLYHGDRLRLPLNEVIARMRGDLVIKDNGPGFIRISFTYPDRFKAQQTVAALVTRFTNLQMAPRGEFALRHWRPRDADWVKSAGEVCAGRVGENYINCIRLLDAEYFPDLQTSPTPPAPGERNVLLDPPSLPETPVAPNRWILAGAGLFAGLLGGAYFVRNNQPVKGPAHA